jgi:glycosyltransferase involved in cell wall biosynthesis
MKILLMGDASNFHHSLSLGLRKAGHDVVVASNGSRWMDTERDIDLHRSHGKFGGMVYWLTLQMKKSLFTGFDVVSIVNPIFIEQRPKRNKIFFDYLKQNNKKIFLTALGTDPFYVEECLDINSPLRYSEWRIGNNTGPLQLSDKGAVNRWLSTQLVQECHHVYDNLDGAVTALYEYQCSVSKHLPKEKVAYGGIPIDTDAIQPIALPDNPDKIKFFLGMHSYRQAEKGTDRLLAVAKRIVDAYPDKCELEIVRNLPYNEYLGRMRNAHVVLDQLYSYTPATNALIAMAMGLNVVSGAEPEYYDFIGEDKLHPIINAIPDDEELYHTLEDIVTHPEYLARRGRESREFVVKHNSLSVVSNRFIRFWEDRL